MIAFYASETDDKDPLSCFLYEAGLESTPKNNTFRFQERICEKSGRHPGTFSDVG